MNDNFERAIAFVLEQEGGYVNNPADHGGETKYGISKRAYQSLDIGNLTINEAKEIYRRDYWNTVGCDQMEWPLCLVVFDSAVNCGVHRAVEWANNAQTWQDVLIMRTKHYAGLNQPVFLKGWLRRIVALWEYVHEIPHPISETYAGH